MAFVPVINFCLEKDEDGNYYLQITDITDVYDDPDNLTGWEDASTLLAADVDTLTAELTITDSSNNETTFTLDSITSLSNPVVGTFDLIPITSSDISLVDGFYKVVYTITSGNYVYTACKQKMIYPSVACCIHKSVLKLLKDPSDASQQVYVDKLKATEFALIEAAKTVDPMSALKMLSLLEDYCKSPQSNCGCGC
jgi:hypothetical protein